MSLTSVRSKVEQCSDNERMIQLTANQVSTRPHINVTHTHFQRENIALILCDQQITFEIKKKDDNPRHKLNCVIFYLHLMFSYQLDYREIPF